jgi:hypothetical protein
VTEVAAGRELVVLHVTDARIRARITSVIPPCLRRRQTPPPLGPSFPFAAGTLSLPPITSLVFKYPSGFNKGVTWETSTTSLTKQANQSVKMGGTRAEKEVYFEKLKALIGQYRESI